MQKNNKYDVANNNTSSINDLHHNKILPMPTEQNKNVSNNVIEYENFSTMDLNNNNDN